MKNSFKDYVWMTVGALLMGLGVYFFEFPNHFSTGGVTGISILLAEVFPSISAGLFMLVINVALLIIGFIIIGRDFGFKTVYCSLLISGVSYVLEFIYPMSAPLTNDTLLELVFAVFLPGVGAAIMFNVSASSGGTDIVAMIIKKYAKINISKALFMADIVVVCLSAFVFNVQVWFYCVVGFLCRVLVVDNVIESMNTSKYFTIITSRAKEIADYITIDLDQGATMSNAYTGVYTGEQKTVILTVVRRRNAVALRHRIKEIDPDAFVIINNSMDIIGNGFREIV
ncbi:MAG: YitT family protein [Clostridia bacterium]|nr:YitT family protein [Clostridia bacterium]